MTPRSFLLSCLLLFSVTVHAGDWPSWRGPTGLGATDEKDLPRTWGGKDNVLWKVPLTGAGQSSPVVWRDRVIITTAHWPDGRAKTEYPDHHVTCYRTTDGKQLWDTLVEPGPWLLKDLRGGYAAPTPATDGERVYVLFGSAVLAALDLDGKVVWRKDIPKPISFDVAVASSPILYKDNVLLLCDMTGKNSRLFAFDKKTGDVKWEAKRPDVAFGHSTPILIDVKGKTQFVIGASNAIQGLDPADGKLIWKCDSVGDVPTPVFGAGIVYCDNGRNGTGIAVDPTGEGDVTKTHLKWKTKKAIDGFGSAVIVGDYLYRLASPGVLTCYKAATGEEVYSERLDGASSAISPFVTADGLIYYASAGRSHVVEAGPKFKLVAVNDLGDPSAASGQASPAVSGGRIFLKGTKNLWCIGKK